MRAKDGARREKDVVLPRAMSQRKRIVDLGQPRPDEHPVRWLDKRFEPDPLEAARNLDARFAEPFVQTGEIFSIMPVNQHHVDQPLGELRRRDAGQHLDVGKLLHEARRGRDKSDPQAARQSLRELRT